MKAIVDHRGQRRKARGFSVAEAVEAGLTWQDCARFKVRLDPKRSTSYKENVKTLKELVKSVPAAKKKPKKTKAQRKAAKKAPAKPAAKK